MATYLIFDRNTGEVVHTHTEPDELRTPREGLLAMVEASFERDALDVTTADAEQFHFGEVHRIDPKSTQVQATTGGAGFGAGDSGAATGQLPPGVRTIYQPESPAGKRRTVEEQ